MTQKLKDKYIEWGLNINIDKTKYLCIAGPSRNLHLEDDETILPGEEYKYLGIKLCKDGEKYTWNKAMNSVWQNDNQKIEWNLVEKKFGGRKATRDAVKPLSVCVCVCVAYLIIASYVSCFHKPVFLL